MSTDSHNQNNPQENLPKNTENGSCPLSSSKVSMFANNKSEPYYAWMKTWADVISKPHL